MIGRIPILDVQPAEGCGRWPAKAVVGETFTVSATGFRGDAGEQDADPTNDTDCKTASDRGSIVHAAELQVY